jgi:hypothetical protein
MLTFAERRTPYRLHEFRASWFFIAFAAADAFALAVGGNFVIGSVIAAVGQPMLISMWCMLGRGTAWFRWSTGIALCALLWIVKVKAFGINLQVAWFLAPMIAQHFLLFPLAIACGQELPIHASNCDRAVADGTPWRFRILDLFYLVTLVAVVCAIARVLLPDGIGEPGFPPGLFNWIMLLAFAAAYSLLQGSLVFYLVWKIWAMEVRLIRRLQSAGVEELMLVLLALFTCLACSIGLSVGLELLVMFPLIAWLRRGERIPRWDGR